METINTIEQTVKTKSNAALWTGRIISGLCILFLLVDALMKVFNAAPPNEGTQQLDWVNPPIQEIGFLLLGCTILYSIPRTAIFGAIFLTAYLGGATSIMVRAGVPYIFPVIFGALVWVGLYLRDERLRKLVPFRQGTVRKDPILS